MHTIVHMAAEGVESVKLLIRHGLVSDVNANVRAFESSGASVKTRLLQNIEPDDLGREKPKPVLLNGRHKRVHRGLHLKALADDLLLQFHRIADAGFQEIGGFVDAEKNDPAVGLVRKARERIVEARAARSGISDFERAGFALGFLDKVQQVEQLFGRHEAKVIFGFNLYLQLPANFYSRPRCSLKTAAIA